MIFLWSSGCWQFDLWFFCLFYNQLVHLEVLGSRTAETSVSSVQSLSRVWLFVTPWTVARQASLSITNSQSLLKLVSIKLVMLSNHLILCVASQECMSQPSLLFPSYWFCVEHFYSLSYIGVFLPVSSLLLGKIIPHIDVFLIFSWGKVSSAFFYSTILISEAVFLLSNSLVSKSLWLFLFF